MATVTEEITILRANDGRGDEYMSEELLADANGNGALDRREPPQPEPPHPSSLIPHPSTYGWREWRRLAQVARVLGTLALYLFLDGYEVRAAFARKALEKMRESVGPDNPRGQLRVWWRGIVWEWQDRLTRAARWWVFRSLDGDKDKRLEKQALWLRENLTKLGPTFIKIGQSLGTRADLLPLPYIKELALLQDNVPAFPNAEAFARIEQELGQPVTALYAEIDAEPVAAASLGQVYRGRMFTGEEVAIKVQRPHLAETIELDISILKRITDFVSRYPSLNENADWAGMLVEFNEIIHEEMDYKQEARNAERFRQNFKDWRVIRVPQIHWTHTTRRVMTMEFIRGHKVTDIEGLTAKGFSPPKVLRLMSRAYLKQLLEDGFFHADPHPGNLLVMDNGQLAFFDFGMAGRIDAKLQAKMIDAFFHVVAKDVEGVAQDLIELDFLKPSVDPERVRPVVINLFSHYLNLKLGEIRFKELTYELADVMYDYPFRLPSNFTYIIRALMTLEGIGIITDPDFSFFETAKPFAKEFMLKREGKQFRKLLVDKITGRDADGKIDWGKMWKLGKMAVKAYFDKR
jgi:predicted unusual protein kinase regulating ubiquinone biosynthesis (AarF/ABC1/UbiB family)